MKEEGAAEKGKAAATQTEASHEAHHGGCLNAIELCAIGHAEVKVEGDMLQLLVRRRRERDGQGGPRAGHGDPPGREA